MVIKSRIRERYINAVMVILLFILTGIYSCVTQAQSFVSVNYTDRDPMSRVKNTEKGIRHIEHFDPNAQAVPVSLSMNGPFEEIKPATVPGGHRLYFSRVSNPYNTVGKADQEDIWYVEFDESTDTWSQPKRMPGFLNNDGPNYINNVSLTGDTIVLGNQYLKKGKMKAGLSYSVNVNGQWSFPEPIRIKNDYNISPHANAYVSVKSGVIIQAIQRAETLGERDLYVSFWNGIIATEPVNMGAIINSELEEASPYLSMDNTTLYFASKGHNGYGGFDIYASKRLDDTWTNWSEPENLGPAINGPLDDTFFSISHCGNYAVFSKQVSVHNVDIYRITLEDLVLEPAKRFYRKERESEDWISPLTKL